MNISLVLPAFNEEKNIEATLDFLTKAKEIDEIIVVNDGSTDLTEQICKQYSSLRLINNTENVGKTKAVLKGIEQAKNDHILLFDADLLGLRHEYITRLINKYQQGYDMVIMDYGDMNWFLYRVVKMVTALSGVRILHKKYFSKIPFKHKDSFELETEINTYFLQHNLSIAVVEAKTLKTPPKAAKYSISTALVAETKAFKEYMLVYGIKGIPFILKSWQTIYNLRNK